jgi:hypothetical protein
MLSVLVSLSFLFFATKTYDYHRFWVNHCQCVQKELMENQKALLFADAQERNMAVVGEGEGEEEQKETQEGS